MGRIGLIFAILALGPPASALDEALYAEILQRHTREVADTAGVRVDYRALRGAAEWKRLLASVESSDPEKLGSRAAKIAFWRAVTNKRLTVQSENVSNNLQIKWPPGLKVSKAVNNSDSKIRPDTNSWMFSI